MFRDSLIVIGALWIGLPGHAQNVREKLPVTVPVKSGGTLDWHTGRWRRGGGAFANAPGATVIYNNTCAWAGGQFFGTADACEQVYDEGRIPTADAADPINAVTSMTSNSYTFCGFDFTYCTGQMVGAFGMDFGFYQGLLSQGIGGACGGPYSPAAAANGLQITALNIPASPNGIFMGCWNVTVDLSNNANGGFVFQGNDDVAFTGVANEDLFGWSWAPAQLTTNLANPTGLFISGEPAVAVTGGEGTFDIPAATCGGSGLDTTDNFWINMDQGQAVCTSPSGCYFFGGYPGNPFSSWNLTMSGVPSGPPPLACASYCVAKPSSSGCLASMSCDPSPLVSGANDWNVSVSGVQGNRPGLFFTANTAPAVIPFQVSGILCMFPPLVRGATMFSFGTNGACDGGFTQTINDGAILPSGFDAGPGSTTFIQAWYRDPLVLDSGTALSDAIEINWDGGAPGGGGPCDSTAVSITAPDTALCVDQTAAFTALGLFVGGTYSWAVLDAGGTQVSIQSGQNSSTVVLDAGPDLSVFPAEVILGVTYTPPGCPSVNAAVSLTVVNDGSCDTLVETGQSIQETIDLQPNATLITVESGTFDGFTVDDRDLTIVGSGSTIISGPVSVENTAVGDIVALVALELNSLDITDNAGTVILSELIFNEDTLTSPADRNALIQCMNSADVRGSILTVDLLGEVTSQHAVGASSGRLELAQCTAFAANGADATDDLDASPAGFGLLLEEGGKCHLALTGMDGGEGGSARAAGQLGGQAGDGGHAIRIEGPSQLILSPGTRFAGGAGGLSLWGYDGAGGNAISLFQDGQAKSVRLSGVGLVPGDGGPSAEDGDEQGPIVITDSIEEPLIQDPALELIGDPISGVQYTLRVYAEPGSQVTLLRGVEPQVVSSPGVAVESLVLSNQSFNLGVVPASGFVERNQTLNLSFGSLRIYQAEVTSTAGLERTNSVPVIIR